MKKEAIDLIIEKNPKLAKSRAKLEAMQAGSFCLHRSWGFGKIREYDVASGKLIIEFDGDKTAHPMDPAFCVERLEILPASNILVRARNEPTVIDDLVKKHPADLVVEILHHAPDRTMSAIELENLLTRLLGERFKKWWSGAKKHLAKDARVAVPTRKSAPFSLREEPVKPEQQILEEYYVTKQAKKKILLAEKLYSISNSVEEIEKDLPRIFDDLTLTIREARQLTTADRLHGVWVRNDLARHLHAEVDKLEPTSESIILGCPELSQLAEQLPSNFQRRFLDVITRVFPDSWQEVVINLLRNSAGKFTSECISFLVDKECSDQVADCFRRWLNEQTLKTSVLLWIIRNRHSRKFAKLVDGMISPRLLAAIFYAIDNEALQNTSNRRIVLADALSDDPDLIADLLADANDETARDLAQNRSTTARRNTKIWCRSKFLKTRSPSRPPANWATCAKTPSTRWPVRNRILSSRANRCSKAKCPAPAPPTFLKPSATMSAWVPSSSCSTKNPAARTVTPFWARGTAAPKKAFSPTRRRSASNCWARKWAMWYAPKSKAPSRNGP